MCTANKKWLRGSLLAGIYLLGVLGIVACGGGGGGNDDVTPPSNTIPPVVADLANMFFFGSLDQPFDAELYDYTASVDYSFRFIQITPVTADPNATVTVNGETVRSGFASSPIEQFAGVINNPIPIIVISEDKKYTKTYRLVITVGPPSSITGLSELSLSDGVLNPLFNTDVTNYSSSVEYPIDALQITPTSVHAASMIDINNEIVQSGLPSDPVALAVGANSIVINITAEDGVTNKIYDIHISREAPSTNANLTDLTISPGIISPIFMSDITEYSSNVSFADTSVQITAVTGDSKATITVKNIDTLSGNPSLPVHLGEGSNLVAIEVTAEDGVTRKIYNIMIDRQSTSDFIQQAYIKASEAETGDQFGFSIALSGDTLAVGAPGEDSNATGVNGDELDNSAPDSGAVYVFTRDINGTWSQQAYLKPSATLADYNFGWSLALLDDTLAVGAPNEDSNTTGVSVTGYPVNIGAIDSGVVYVFTRDATNTWSQQAYIKASNTGAGDNFGWSVAMFGDMLAVGAPNEDSNISTGSNHNFCPYNSVVDSGAVYVFRRTVSGTWYQQACLKASNVGAGDRFGGSVALGWSDAQSTDTLVVGAINESSAATGDNGDESNNDSSYSGAVYVLSFYPNEWQQSTYLKASNTGFGDAFGSSISLFGDYLAVGAPSEGSNATGISGDESNNSMWGAGAVYLFKRLGFQQWFQTGYLKASNTGASDNFGTSVSMISDTLAVGARFEESSATGVYNILDDDSSSASGAAYIFSITANGWPDQQIAFVKASNSEAGDQFGVSIAQSRETLAVGAVYEASNSSGVNGNQADNSASGAGAVYVYH